MQCTCRSRGRLNGQSHFECCVAINIAVQQASGFPNWHPPAAWRLRLRPREQDRSNRGEINRRRCVISPARGTRWLYVVASDCPTVRAGRSKLWHIDETAIAGHWTAGRICTTARSREETWRFTHFDRALDPFRWIGLRNCCHQRARIGMERIIEDRPRPGLLYDPAHIHDSNAAADLSDHAKVV